MENKNPGFHIVPALLRNTRRSMCAAHRWAPYRYQEYISQGMSEEEASRKVFRTLRYQTMEEEEEDVNP